MPKHLLFLLGLLLTVCVGHAQNITVYSAGKVAVGGTRKLTAYVPLSPNTVAWTVNGIPGGDATYGTIAPDGLYTAPATVPPDNVVSVRATSTAYPAKWHAVDITISQPFLNLWSARPGEIPAGNFTIRLGGTNFTPASVAQFNGAPLATTFVSPIEVRATGVADASLAGTTAQITVTQPGVGGMTTPPVPLKITAPIVVTVNVSPASATVTTGATRQFSATVTGSSNHAVTWSVDGIVGGNATVGTISSSGFYTAPASPPMSPTVTVRATSAANNASFGQATVTIEAPPAPPPPAIAVTLTPQAAILAPNATQAFSADVSGTANNAVAWSVNGVVGGNSTFGTIGTTGLFQAPAATPIPSTVTVRATSLADAAAHAEATITIAAGDPSVPPPPPTGSLSHLAAARLLEQATFGPTAGSLAQVRSIGIDAWLDEQFALPETAIAMPSDNRGAQAQYLHRLSTAPDQLRQRVAYALSTIIVISINKNNYPNEIVPYLQILSRNAFGNYRTLLDEITRSPQMGKYLDLANSNKPSAGSAANENYARELMQLFTIGLYQLNPDGSPQLDENGNPIRAYEQATVQQVALALTGWTFPGPGNNNWENFSGPLQPREVNHDTTAKTLVGVTLPAGQTAAQDMAAVLDWVFNHPNTAPFVATRLIRALVASNPTPAYIERISTVFADNGSGVRGDLRAVVRAILADPEARNDAPSATSGRLKDPIYHVVAFMRALGGSISPTNQQAWYFSRMSQTPLAPASVFGFYSPLFRIPRSSLMGPEFQIYGPTEAVLRGNMFWEILSHPGSDFPWDISPWIALANDTNALLDAVDRTLLYGRMPSGMRSAIAQAVNAQSTATDKARTALYLAALSGLYAVQY